MPAPRPADPDDGVFQEAAGTFGLLSSAVRLHIVWVLAQGECDVTSLAERVGGSLPAVSQHLAKLKLAGLVHARREGRRQVYLVDDPALVTVVRLMVGQHDARAAGRDVPAAGAQGLPAPMALPSAGLPPVGLLPAGLPGVEERDSRGLGT
jgi:DNA-binding transcriptional ArsR family regulator